MKKIEEREGKGEGGREGGREGEGERERERVRCMPVCLAPQYKKRKKIGARLSLPRNGTQEAIFTSAKNQHKILSSLWVGI